VLLALACLAAGLGGCTANPADTAAQDFGDYLNLRNSFLNPAEVGRFDKANPFGNVRPTRWPILEQLDVIDEPNDHWTTATDPTPADIQTETKEYVLGPGDTIRVTVFELVQPGQDYVKDGVISETGTITTQNLGAVQAAGLTASQLEEKLGQLAVEKNLLLPKGNGNPGPQISVTLLQSRARVFSILGAISQPGSYNILGNDFRLLDAIALARDIPVQPGMDYIYVIRQVAYKPGEAATTQAAPATTTTTSAPGTGPSAFEDIEAIEKAAKTQPATIPAPASAPASAPAPGPSGEAPRFVRPLPLAAVSTGHEKMVVSAVDLDQAISGGVVTPAPASAPAVGTSAIVPATAEAATATAAATTQSAESLLNSALNPPTTQQAGNYVFLDGKWVFVPAATAPATQVAATTPLPPAPTITVPPEAAPVAPEGQLTQQRVIRIPISALREGSPRYNIIIRAGDVINVPSVEPGEFYMLGNVSRPGVYTLTGRKITLKMAVASAGNLGPLAIPRRCEVVRRIGQNQEAIVQVNLQAVFNGEQPDIFLKPNDVVNVGTDAIAPWLSVMRNAYRFSYGFGFVYDRNYAPQQATH
jgi:polysaccharide export outer membrane protein